MKEVLFASAAILGLGQMGASLGLALRKSGLVGFITGYDPYADHSSTALSMGAIDELAISPELACTDADLIILCAPVGCYGALMQAIAPQLKPGATVTDIGSIKAQAIRDVWPHLPQGVHFVPAHPIAGSEKVGPYHARANFFEDHLFLITPIENTPEPAVEPIARLWHATGARVDLLMPELHDQIYAYMSHLPQLIAYAAMPVLDRHGIRLGDNEAIFRRFIRIGRSDPEMWRDVFLENAEHIQAAAANVEAIIAHMRDELLLGKGDRPAPDAPPPLEHFCKILWPRMLASAMVVTVQLIENQLDMKLARYAAGGFTDVSCPAIESTEEDFSAVSHHADSMIALLSDYLEHQQRIVGAIANGNKDALLSELAHCQAAGKKLITE